MPRIRTIKPEFFDSPGTAQASYEGRLFFIALWCWADDYGIGTANPKQLIGFAFPNDPVTHTDFPRLRTEVATCFGIAWYEVDGRPYYAIPSWDTHQKNERRATRRNPGPDKGKRTDTEMRGASVQTDGSSGPGTGEQGNRGTGEKTSSSEVADATLRPDIEEILDYFDAALTANDPHVKLPTRTKKNADAARLLIDKDDRTLDQVKACIDFATNDEFWRNNILSMSKLREKYDQLRRKAQQRPGANRQQQESDDFLNRAMARAIERDHQQEAS